MENNELDQIKHYLNSNLEVVITDKNDYRCSKTAKVESMHFNIKNNAHTIYHTNLGSFYIGQAVPLLYPSNIIHEDLTINGELINIVDKVSGIGYKIEKVGTHWYSFKLDDSCMGILALPYTVIEIFVKYKVDIFNLIGRGLAVNITETSNFLKNKKYGQE